ncbi:hypothetical protein DFAR_340030 [Desulfarculales bacterium]
MTKVLGKDPAQTIVIIEELFSDNWSAGGQSITTLRAKTKG